MISICFLVPVRNHSEDAVHYHRYTTNLCICLKIHVTVKLLPIITKLSQCCLCFSQCYKSSKEQTPLLDVSLLGCSVVYKEKQLKRKEHKLKIIPVGGEAIVLGLQSKEQTEQWLKVTNSQRYVFLRNPAILIGILN